MHLNQQKKVLIKTELNTFHDFNGLTKLYVQVNHKYHNGRFATNEINSARVVADIGGKTAQLTENRFKTKEDCERHLVWIAEQFSQLNEAVNFEKPFLIIDLTQGDQPTDDKQTEGTIEHKDN